MRTRFARTFALACPMILAFGSAAVAAPDTPSQEAASPEDKAKTPDEPKKENRAEEIVTQPVRDVGLAKKEIPPILQSAVEKPYARPAGKCAAITGELAQLNAALGPDFGTGTKENENKIGKIAAIGGSAIVNSLIPFRGLVREVSGAAPAERRLAAAVSAGMARRGYLRAIAETRGCRMPK